MAIYMKVSGVSGDVTTKGYENWINLQDVDFAGVQRRVNLTVGKQMNHHINQPSFGEFTIIKQLDKSSHRFFEAAHSEEVLPSIEIHYITTGNPNFAYAKLKLSNSVITHYSDRHNANAKTQPREIIRIAYTKMERTFIPRDANNSASSPFITGFNLETAEKL